MRPAYAVKKDRGSIIALHGLFPVPGLTASCRAVYPHSLSRSMLRLANRDLQEIGDYVAEELKNPIAAYNTVSKILDSIDRLAEHPQSGAPLSARYEDVGNYRYLVSGSYLAFYRTTDDMVFVDCILYGRRDYISILFADLPKNE